MCPQLSTQALIFGLWGVVEGVEDAVPGVTRSGGELSTGLLNHRGPARGARRLERLRDHDRAAEDREREHGYRCGDPPHRANVQGASAVAVDGRTAVADDQSVTAARAGALLTLVGLLAVVAGCGGNERTVSPKNACYEWIEDVDEQVVEVDDDVAELIHEVGLGGQDPDLVCDDAVDRGALDADGKIKPTRLAEVVACSVWNEKCGPHRLRGLIRDDPRFAKLSVVARTVLLDAVVSLSDYDGFVKTEYSHPADTKEFKLIRHEGIRAIAYLAGVTVKQARLGIAEIEGQKLARSGSGIDLEPRLSALRGLRAQQGLHRRGSHARKTNARFARPRRTIAP